MELLINLLRIKCCSYFRRPSGSFCTHFLFTVTLCRCCCRLSRKQKKFPVKIGTCGETRKYPVYKDIRIRTLARVVSFAESEKILGISCLCDNILVNPVIVNEIKKRNLILSTWGEDDNNEETREKQRRLGVDVLCFDRYYQVICF